MTPSSQATCWVVTDGKAGMENQCIGLAEAIGVKPLVKRTVLRPPWKQLSPFLRVGLRHAFSPEGDPIRPPWPDLVIATGRGSIPASLYIRRDSVSQGQPGTFTVQLQNPVISPTRFDLVVVPRHDGLTGPNIITTRGALHRVTGAMLEREAASLLPQIAHLPRPRIVVLIGGSNAVYQLTPREMTPLVRHLAELARQTKGSLIITPSRRTGDDNLAILQQGLQGLPCFIWDGKGSNPYYGMLGVADYILATCDSVNMVSEACTTGKPVYVINLPGGSDKFRRFHQSMRDDGLTRTFEGHLEDFSYAPLNDMQLVADRITDELRKRGKV
ncbi:MAG: mitochondrial fission ELM1 family protein [Pseudomonadota bacterium]|nr:mitochondrial fission ELM1 family protein [Pseudomonadota bacterium]